jgi:hypothetical protein
VKYLLQKFTHIAILSIFFGASFYQAAKAEVIDSSFYNWTVYENQDDEIEDKECYIVAHPVKSNTDHSSRQDPYIMITHFQRNRIEEVSVFSGFEFKMNSEVFMMIADEQFKFLAKKDLAWMRSKSEDARLIKTMLNSAAAKIRSDSAIGTYAVDEYSLKGITRAYERMREICK